MLSLSLYDQTISLDVKPHIVFFSQTIFTDIHYLILLDTVECCEIMLTDINLLNAVNPSLFIGVDLKLWSILYIAL
jgi:hypothetical protein